MDQFLFQDLPEQKRAAQLEALSEGMEERDYSVFLTQEELQQRKSQFATLAIQEAKVIDKKVTFLAEIKAELNPIKVEKQQALTEIKSGTIPERGICYKVVDRDTKMVGFYNKRGQLVDQRIMNADDQQLVIKTAVNQ